VADIVGIDNAEEENRQKHINQIQQKFTWKIQIGKNYGVEHKSTIFREITEMGGENLTAALFNGTLSTSLQKSHTP